MIYGVDYYPEHWNRDEWEKNAALMKKGNFNTVRMAEFAWKKLEPQEGIFDFEWLDEAIKVLAAKGIKVILGTPTAAPPKWLVNKYDVLMRDSFGKPEGFGARRECCANNPVYLEKAAIITEKMAEHYRDNPDVIAWQIDNEFGCHASTRCYCEHCRRAFGKWLSNRYKSIDELNRIWGNVFWSLDYESFEDVILPAYTSCDPENGRQFSHNPSLDMEYRRFASDTWVNYQQMQLDILHKYTKLPVTHNFMGHFSDIDYFDLSRNLDVVSWDNYPDNQWGTSDYEYVSMAHDIMRGIKNKNFWVMEEQAGACGWDIVGATPRPDQLRLWAYQAVAHGAEGMVYFRFRSALFGMEQYWHGVLDHDGIPRRRFYELQKTGEEMQRLEKYIVGAENDAQVLLVKSYDNVWAHEIKRHTRGFNYNSLLYSFYKANADRNIQMSVGRDRFDKYKIVYLPAYNITDEATVKEAEEFVENGGTLVLTFRSGTRDMYNNMRAETVPGPFRKLAGLTVEEFDAVRKPVMLEGLGVQGSAGIWCDILKPDEAVKVLFTYRSEYYKGTAAVTEHAYGRGRVFYIACDLDETSCGALAGYVAEVSGVSPSYEKIIPGVEIIRRKKGEESYMMILNHTEQTQSVPKGYSLLNEKAFDGELAGFDVEILKY